MLCSLAAPAQTPIAVAHDHKPDTLEHRQDTKVKMRGQNDDDRNEDRAGKGAAISREARGVGGANRAAGAGHGLTLLRQLTRPLTLPEDPSARLVETLPNLITRQLTKYQLLKIIGQSIPNYILKKRLLEIAS